MERLRPWLTMLVPLLVAAIAFGTLRATTDANAGRIDVLERKLDERSLSLDATGTGRLLLEKLSQINERLERIDKRLERLERRGH